jgi:hypothetical protein
VRGVAWEVEIRVVLLRYFGSAKEQSARLGRCRFRFVEKAIVEDVERQGTTQL